MEYGFLKPEDEIFPPIVHVENTNVCNLKCIHCPHYDILNIVPNYKPQSIKMNLWKKIVDEVAQYRCALRLTPDGEPLLPRDFTEQVQYALDRRIYIFTLNTNGVYLEGDKVEVFLQPTETKISLEVSLDGLFRETYSKIRLNSNYHRVMRNIMNLVYERDRRNLENLKIVVSIVQQPEVPGGELEIFNRFWSQVVDKVIIRNYVDTKGLMPRKDIDRRVVKDRWPCPVVFTRLIVTYDGTVRFCPDDWQKSTRLPSLNEAGSLKAIWQSEEYQKLRESHLAGTFDHPSCTECTDWKVIRWGFDYCAALEDIFDENRNITEKDDNLKYLWDREHGGQTSIGVAGEGDN